MAWHKAAEIGELATKDVVGVEVNGQEIAIYKLDGAFYATGNICTHQFAFMSEGYVENGCIECPLHQGLFDIKSGTVVDGPPEQPLATFPVRVDGDAILVELSD
jgi:nitrite reductase/ring-hydroxylating ferredoxin subunit